MSPSHELDDCTEGRREETEERSGGDCRDEKDFEEADDCGEGSSDGNETTACDPD